MREVGRYLQYRIRAWVAEGGRTASDLARAAGVTKERVSTIQATGKVGTKIAEQLGMFFGHPDLAATIAAAKEWALREPEPVPMVTQLGLHPDWPQVVRDAQRAFPGVDQRAFDEVAKLSSPEGLPRRLDAADVGRLAQEMDAFIRRAAARQRLEAGQKASD